MIHTSEGRISARSRTFVLCHDSANALPPTEETDTCFFLPHQGQRRDSFLKILSQKQNIRACLVCTKVTIPSQKATMTKAKYRNTTASAELGCQKDPYTNKQSIQALV